MGSGARRIQFLTHRAPDTLEHDARPLGRALAAPEGGQPADDDGGAAVEAEPGACVRVGLAPDQRGVGRTPQDEAVAEGVLRLAAGQMVALAGDDELRAAIRERNLNETFSIVSLLIGVNNQYRGRSLDNYKEEFLQLLEQAIHFANGHSDRISYCIVVVGTLAIEADF